MALYTFVNGERKKISSPAQLPKIFINGAKKTLSKGYTFINGERKILWGREGIVVEDIPLGSLIGSGITGVDSLCIIKNKAFIIYPGNKLHTFDITNPSSPQLIDTKTWGETSCYSAPDSNETKSVWYLTENVQEGFNFGKSQVFNQLTFNTDGTVSVSNAKALAVGEWSRAAFVEGLWSGLWTGKKIVGGTSVIQAWWFRDGINKYQIGPLSPSDYFAPRSMGKIDPKTVTLVQARSIYYCLNDNYITSELYNGSPNWVLADGDALLISFLPMSRVADTIGSVKKINKETKELIWEYKKAEYPQDYAYAIIGKIRDKYLICETHLAVSGRPSKVIALNAETGTFYAESAVLPVPFLQRYEPVVRPPKAEFASRPHIALGDYLPLFSSPNNRLFRISVN